MPADLALYLVGAAIAAFVAGLAGFAFALLSAPLWLHVLPPVEVTALIVAYGVVIQTYALWGLRRAIRLDLLWPFLLGGAIGVPIGTWVVDIADPAAFKLGVGIFLVAYSAFQLARPRLATVAWGGPPADGAVGFVGGVLGGMAGFSGVLVTLWCGLRGWPKDVQRAVFQPYILVTHSLTLATLWLRGAIGDDVPEYFLIGLVVVLVAMGLGFRFYRSISEQGFRRLVLWLLLVSGLSLVF